MTKQEMFNEYIVPVEHDANNCDEWFVGWIRSLPELIRCNDCIYGYLYMDVQNGVTDRWIECRNPDGLNRDTSVDSFCSAAERREDD